jgi:hypothetical protein
MKNLIGIIYLVILLVFISSCSSDDPEPQIRIAVDNFTASIDEGPQEGEVIGQVSASISEGTLSYALIDQSPEGALAIDPNTGVLTVADNALFDFETAPVISGIVRASGGGQSAEATVTINLNDIDESADFNIWKGQKITFTKGNGADPGNEANQDRITENVWLTRGNNGGQIYNAKSENSASKGSSPADTEWAYGVSEEIAGLEFKPFREALGNPKAIVGKDIVLHLITDDIYIDIKFTSWAQGKVGGFSYERSSKE